MEQVGLELIAKDAGQYVADVTRASKVTQQFTGGLSDSQKSAGVYIDAMGRVRDANGRFVAGMGSAGEKVTAFEQIAIGAFRRVGAAAIELAATAGQQLIGFMTDSIGVAGDFESGMNEFAAVAGRALEESGVSLEQFRDQFIDIGKELPVSTSEVQQAAIELVKGGLDPATVAAGGLRQSIQFAAAAGLDLEQAATIAAKAVGGWTSPFASAQEKADFLTHSTDLLARAANASTVNVDDLALGLYNVQGTAKLAGASFDETVTALAQLAPSFSSSADAGTSLKTFLARLQPSTDPAIDAMKDLGLWTNETGSAFYDAKGEFVGMEKASQLLYEATKGLTEAEREQYLQTIFGQDAIRAAAVFAEQGAAGYDLMSDSLAKQNSVAEMAAQKQQGFNTALDNARGSVEALQITIGSYLLPVLTDLLNNYIAPAINTIATFAERVFSATDPVAALAGELNGLVPGIGSIVTLASDLVTQLSSVSVSGKETGSVLKTIGPILDMLMFPLTAVGIASTTLATAWNTNLGGIRDTTTSVMTTVMSVVTTIMTQLSLFWQANGAEITAFVQQTWTQISEIIALTMQLIDATIVPALQSIAAFITAHSTEIQTILRAAWTVISTLIKTTMDTIKGLLTIALAVIKGDWSGAWTAVKGILQTQLDGAHKILVAGMELFIAAWKLAWEWIVKQVQDSTGGIVGWIIQTMIAIRNALSQWVNSIGGAASMVGNAIADGIKKGIESGASAIINAAKNAAQSALNAAKKALGISSPSKVFELEVGRQMMAGAEQGIKRGTDSFAATTARSVITPVASAQHIRNQTTTNNYYGQIGNSYAMPVYTIQSPAVVQQSMQIAQALAL